MRRPLPYLIALSVGILVYLVASPAPDLFVSGLFYRPGDGFVLHNMSALRFMTAAAHDIAFVMASFFIFTIALCMLRRKALFGMRTRAWLYLLFTLLVGPGLIANVVFKNHWGRARPYQITEFGGVAHYTPPLVPAQECDTNCSFVSGDGAFGFFLPAFAYVLPIKRRKRAFWLLLTFGSLFGIGRLLSGAHFLSDVLYAALFTLATNALLYRLLYRAQANENPEAAI